MNTQAFRKFLEEPLHQQARINVFVGFIKKFNLFCEKAGARSPSDVFAACSAKIIMEKTNTFDNYYALVLYGRFLKDNALMLSALELIDGGEVLDNLYKKTGEVLGNA